MVALIVHAILGVTVVWLIVVSNPAVFRRSAAATAPAAETATATATVTAPTGPRISVLEAVYYTAGIASVVIGWYFNIRFVRDYSHGHGNPIWGDGSWAQYIKLMYANPAAGSAGQDYTIGNLVLLPLMTIVDGRRRGIRRPYLFFVASLFTSFAFPWALYLAIVERQRRLNV